MVDYGKLMVWDSKATPKNPNPFHKRIPGIQTTNPNHQITIPFRDLITSWEW